MISVLLLGGFYVLAFGFISVMMYFGGLASGKESMKAGMSVATSMTIVCLIAALLMP